MSSRLYRRADGLMFVLVPTGEVYEVRLSGLTADLLQRAEAAGLITPGADPSLSAFAGGPPSPPQSRPAPERLRVVR